MAMTDIAGRAFSERHTQAATNTQHNEYHKTFVRTLTPPRDQFDRDLTLDRTPPHHYAGAVEAVADLALRERDV